MPSDSEILQTDDIIDFDTRFYAGDKKLTKFKYDWKFL